MKQSFTKASDGSNQCRNSCGAALGFGLLADGGTKVGAESRPATNPQGYWSISFWRPTDAWKVQMRSGIGSGLYNHQDRVAYCLAEVLDADSDDNACIIGVSNIVLLVVTICVLAKTAQSLLVTRKLVWRPNPEPPVVTLGDAIDIPHPYIVIPHPYIVISISTSSSSSSSSISLSPTLTTTESPIVTSSSSVV